MKIVKTLSDKSEHEIESGGLTSTCTWDQLQPFIGHCIHLRPEEKIDGLIITESGIQVRIGLKNCKTK